MSRFVSAAFCALFVASMGSTAMAAKYDVVAGKKTYDTSCASCHKTGMMGAPKTGDKAAWASRMGQGVDKMTDKSVKGFKGAKGVMPANGGNPKLSKAEIGNAVAYMVQQSK